MRTIKYLSPSSIGVLETDLDEFYLRYLADERPPRAPQTQPMSIGSAFDAYVKSWLHERLFGKGTDPRFELDALLEAQVEAHNLDWAREHGRYVFEQYRQAGCLADHMHELGQAQGDPRFEFEIQGAVSGYREGITATIADVVFLGKPDMHYVNKAGVTVVLDFKVNGYCSTRVQSPMAGYVRLRSAGKTNMGQHKDCLLLSHHGMMINAIKNLEDGNKDWAKQLAIYAWLTGCPVGSEFLVAIDQISCSPNPGGLPQIRIAEHRTRIGGPFQRDVFNRACEIWEVVHSDHVFRNLSPEASRERCAMLDRRSKELRGECAPHDAWFASATRVAPAY
jgi:hypothetical protein